MLEEIKKEFASGRAQRGLENEALEKQIKELEKNNNIRDIFYGSQRTISGPPKTKPRKSACWKTGFLMIMCLPKRWVLARKNSAEDFETMENS